MAVRDRTESPPAPTREELKQLRKQSEESARKIREQGAAAQEAARAAESERAWNNPRLR